MLAPVATSFGAHRESEPVCEPGNGFEVERKQRAAAQSDEHMHHASEKHRSYDSCVRLRHLGAVGRTHASG